MYQIRREKTAFDQELNATTTTTHFAKKVQPDGKVSEWIADEADAQTIDKPLAQAVEKEYKDRRKAGTVTIYGVDDKHELLVVTPPQKGAPVVPPHAGRQPAAPPADPKPEPGKEAADQRPAASHAAHGHAKGK